MDIVKLICWLRGHKINNSNWGYGFGCVDVFCARCQKRVASLAIGRLAPLADCDQPHTRGAASTG